MAIIRKDFQGAVHVAGHVLRAGDQVPVDVMVGKHLIAGGNDPLPVNDVPADSTPVPSKPKRGRPAKTTEK